MKIQDQILTLSKAELRALLAHASEDVTRPHLVGIIVDPSSGRVSATDGHRLLTWAPSERTPIALGDGQGGTRLAPFTIPRLPLEQAAKHAKRAEDPIELHLGAEGAVVKVERDGVTLPVLAAYYEGQPPHVEQAIPDYTETTPAGLMSLDADYLADLALAQKAIGAGVAIQYGPAGLPPAQPPQAPQAQPAPKRSHVRKTQPAPVAAPARADDAFSARARRRDFVAVA